VFWCIEIGNVVSFILPLKRLKKGLSMATVKFDEGTKFETSLDLEEGEGVIFVKPPKNKSERAIGFKVWYVTIVITNKRLVTIPQPPNKKKIQTESFYYKDIKTAKVKSPMTSEGEDNRALFNIILNNGGSSKYEADKKGDNGFFSIKMEMSAKNIIGSFINDIIRGAARNASVANASLSTFDRPHYTDNSVDKYYETMNKQAKERAASLDFAKAGHKDIRDYIVDVVNLCVEEANK